MAALRGTIAELYDTRDYSAAIRFTPALNAAPAGQGEAPDRLVGVGPGRRHLPDVFAHPGLRDAGRRDFDGFGGGISFPGDAVPDSPLYRLDENPNVPMDSQTGAGSLDELVARVARLRAGAPALPASLQRQLDQVRQSVKPPVQSGAKGLGGFPPKSFWT